MPLVCHIACANCSFTTWVPASWLSLQQDDGTLIPLQHPGESPDLARFNLTMDQATRQARIIVTKFAACAGCGRWNKHREIHRPGSNTGCFAAAAACIWVPLAAYILHDLTEISPWYTAPLGVLLAPLAGVTATAIERAKFRRHCHGRPPLHDELCSCAPPDRVSVDIVDAKSLPPSLRRLPSPHGQNHALRHQLKQVSAQCPMQPSSDSAPNGAPGCSHGRSAGP